MSYGERKMLTHIVLPYKFLFRFEGPINKPQFFCVSQVMSTSELPADESSSSESSEITISDFELEVEQFENLSDESSNTSHGQSSLAGSKKASGLIAPAPYNDEPLADAEWIQKYKERKENESIQIKALQGRLDGTIPVSHW